MRWIGPGHVVGKPVLLWDVAQGLAVRLPKRARGFGHVRELGPIRGRNTLVAFSPYLLGQFGLDLFRCRRNVRRDGSEFAGHAPTKQFARMRDAIVWRTDVGRLFDIVTYTDSYTDLIFPTPYGIAHSSKRPFVRPFKGFTHTLTRVLVYIKGPKIPKRIFRHVVIHNVGRGNTNENSDRESKDLVPSNHH